MTTMNDMTGEKKVYIRFHLPADLVAAIKATGPDYAARVEKVLREALAKGRL